METLIEQFRRAYTDPTLCVLEGFHALKHAHRFGAQFLEIASAGSFGSLAASLAPDLLQLESRVRMVPAIDRLSPRKIATGVIAIARRPVLLISDSAPVVLLEEPRHLGNVGAVIRVAAAASAGGVLTTGATDPWHPEAVRGAAGLHFALAVASVTLPLSSGRPVLAFDPAGSPLQDARIPDDAILAFGTERDGLSPAVLEGAHAVVRIPMREGVSSLNLATAVAVGLYHWRLSQG